MFVLTIALFGGPVALATGHTGGDTGSSATGDTAASDTSDTSDSGFPGSGDTGGPCVAPDGTISGLGAAVVTGDTCGAGDDFLQGCGGDDGEELSYSFTAPTTGVYSFDTDGSAFDTVLTLHTACPTDAEIECNDDSAGVGTPSVVLATLIVGQEVIVNVEGFSDDCGTFQVNIFESEGDTGTDTDTDPPDTGERDTDTTPFTPGSTATSLAGEEGGSPWADGCGCEASPGWAAAWGLGSLLRRR